MSSPGASATSRASRRTRRRRVSIGLVGCRAGGNLRSAIVRGAAGRAGQSGTPLTSCSTTWPGSTLISGFVFVRWVDHLPEIRERFSQGAPNRRMVDICSGFQSGSSALRSDGSDHPHNQNTAHPGPLADPADPLGWHELDEPPVPAMRRARRIDVWDEDGTLGIDAMFRDSAWDPDGSEVVVHEYQMLGQADRATGRLLSVTAVPRVLPYAECPGAAPNASRMAGHRPAGHAHRGARAACRPPTAAPTSTTGCAHWPKCRCSAASLPG